jgi:hypothetical protein
MQHLHEVAQRAKASGVKCNWAVIWVGGGSDLLKSQSPRPSPFASVMKK